MENVDVLQFESRPYVSKAGKPAQDRQMIVRLDGKMFAFRVGDTLSDVDANALVSGGKKVSLELSLSTFGASLEPTFRVAGVVVPKK